MSAAEVAALQRAEVLAAFATLSATRTSTRLGRFLATAVLWRLGGDDRWHAGEGITIPPPRGRYDSGPDGSGMLEILLDDIADRYVAFAEDYYEMQVDRSTVDHSVAQIPLTDAVVRALNPEATRADLHADVCRDRIPLSFAV